MARFIAVGVVERREPVFAAAEHGIEGATLTPVLELVLTPEERLG